MELENLKSLWQENNAGLEDRMTINLTTLELIQKQKAKSTLKPLVWIRLIELILHSIVIILLCLFCYYNYKQWPYSLSAYMLIFFYAIVFTHTVTQVRALISVNPNGDILKIQSALAKIRSNNLNWIRLSVLLIPALLSFPVIISKSLIDLRIHAFSFDIIKQTQGRYWTAQIITFVICIPLGLWFRNKISYKNIHEKWVNTLIQKSLGVRVQKALKYLDELQKLSNS